MKKITRRSQKAYQGYGQCSSVGKGACWASLTTCGQPPDPTVEGRNWLFEDCTWLLHARPYILITQACRGARVITANRSHCCSHKGCRYSSQHPPGDSQPSLTLVPGDPMTSSDFQRNQACLWCTCMHVYKQHIHTCKIRYSFKKKMKPIKIIFKIFCKWSQEILPHHYHMALLPLTREHDASGWGERQPPMIIKSIQTFLPLYKIKKTSKPSIMSPN